MKKKLFTGLAALLLGVTGCRNIEPKKEFVVYPSEFQESYSQCIKDMKKFDIIAIPSSVQNLEFDFDEDFRKAQKLTYKSDGVFGDYFQSPEETERLGTGDCEDYAFYLSSLLSKKGIYNEVVFGQVQSADGFILHAWNRVVENNRSYFLDAVSGLKILESEAPKGYLKVFTTIKPEGYSKKDMLRYRILAESHNILPALRNAVTGNPNQRIIGGGRW